MTDTITLPRATVQQALEALEGIHRVGEYPRLQPAITALRVALAESEQVQEPVAHSVIAGALFDFMGWLTSRKKRIVLSSADDASPAVKVITEFAKMRGLSLDDAKVQNWNTAQPQQQAEPVACVACEGRPKGDNIPCAICGAAQRQWVGLTDEEITELRLKNFDAVATNYESYRAIEAKLKEKNNG